MTEEKEHRQRITEPGELLELAKSAARQRFNQLGEDESNPGGETKEQIEKIIKEAYDSPWKGGEYLRMRFAMAAQDLMISEVEYMLATRGSGLYDSTITSALKRFVTPGKRISRRRVNGFYHIKIVDDLSKEAVTKNHDESIRQGEQERLIGIIRALTGEDLDVRIEPITARVLIQAIKLNVKPGDINQ